MLFRSNFEQNWLHLGNFTLFWSILFQFWHYPDKIRQFVTYLTFVITKIGPNPLGPKSKLFCSEWTSLDRNWPLDWLIFTSDSRSNCSQSLQKLCSLIVIMNLVAKLKLRHPSSFHGGRKMCPVIWLPC